MRADQPVTVAMTETVTHELTLTAERLAEITGIGLDQLDTFLADHPAWTGLTGPHGHAVECLLDVIDCDTHRAGAEDRSWTVRQPLAPAPTPGRPDSRGRAIADLIAAYDGNTYRLLSALADRLHLTLAYVDRDTVEAHLERALCDAEWSAIDDQFSALDFDEHVGEAGTLRTDWIENVLDKAGVPGYGYTADGTPGRGGAAA
jgi:hypothetical protein